VIDQQDAEEIQRRHARLVEASVWRVAQSTETARKADDLLSLLIRRRWRESDVAQGPALTAAPQSASSGG
jgi:hypothetical protein